MWYLFSTAFPSRTVCCSKKLYAPKQSLTVSAPHARCPATAPLRMKPRTPRAHTVNRTEPWLMCYRPRVWVQFTPPTLARPSQYPYVPRFPGRKHKTCLHAWGDASVVLQLMSFPGSDAQADAPGAEGEGGKTGEEDVAPIGSVFAVLQAYATHVFAPTVRAYAASRGGDDKVREGYARRRGVRPPGVANP